LIKNDTLIIGDTHFKVGLSLLKQIDYLYNICKDYRYIIFLGDMFENKKSLDVQMIDTLNNRLFDKLKDHEIYILFGNHDMYYKKDYNISTLTILDKMYDNITILFNDELIDINDRLVYPLPFGYQLDSDKMEQCDYVIGHIEVYPYYPHSTIREEEFTKPTFIGHYHIKVDNLYTGTPYGLDYNDIDQIKGVYVIKNLEDNNIDIEFIENRISPKYLSCYYHDNYLFIENKKVSHEDFKNSIDYYSNHIYYIYIDMVNGVASDSTENFLSYCDSKGISYLTRVNSDLLLEDEEVSFISEDIYDTITYFLEKEEDKVIFSQIIEDIKQGELITI
jgi:hypothetical protein